ncbi:aldo/keto reductase [Ceratocystis lukuohia]|uniref:Aldo/keto reductase n=1 Tax=Ceratocystis lukuohia TaxID=2019550 RepID=A0ABR4MCF7_9PEZI
MPSITGKEVGRVGYGLMGLSWRANPCPLPQAVDAMNAALANGANFWNGGEFYGTPAYNSMTVLSAFFVAHPDAATKVVLSMKGGVDNKTLKPDGSPEGVRRSLDNILAGLGGRKFLDIFECARRDPTVPLELTLGTIQKEYVDTGKLGGISLSEVSADTIHAAAKVVKIAAVEAELSLWSLEPLTNGVAAACAQYGIPLVAYSPLGHGMLAGTFRKWEDIPADSSLHHFPRFSKEAFPLNVKLCDLLAGFAEKKGCTSAQLALGWVLAQSKRPGMPEIVVIPGATTAERVKENCAPVELDEAEVGQIDKILAEFEVVGGRYPEGAPINT